MPNYRIRPRIGSELGTAFGEKFLLICLFDPNGIATIWEHIATLQKYSRYRFEVLNLWPGRGQLAALPPTLDLADYVGVMIHPTISYDPETLNNLDTHLNLKFRDFDGIKILSKQDEHYKAAAFPTFIEANRFDMLITCMASDQLAKVYSPDILGRISVLHALAGYVSEDLRSIASPLYEARQLDIAYRGSLQPISFGRLGYEKRQIGAQVLAHPASAVLSLDISSRWEDRLSGVDWFAFLGSSKAILGVESGSNLFDFDGSVAKRCEQFALAHADMDPYSEVFYRAAQTEILGAYEDNVTYCGISPRHFEAAATRSLQIMYPGQYSNIFEAGKHFFALERDLSNFEEAIELIRSPSRAKRMIDAAYEEIILSDEYTYKTFVGKLDKEISRLKDRKNLGSSSPKTKAPSSAGKSRILILCAHDPVTDPRIGWWASSFKDHSVCELGTYRFSENGRGPTIETAGSDHWRIRVERRLNGSVWKSANQEGMLDTPGIRDLALLDIFARSAKGEIVRSLGAFDANEVDFARFTTLCEHIVLTNGALLQAAQNLGPFDAVVAADLEALPAAVALKQFWNCHLVFDSHEYWPFSYPDFRAWESEFWGRLEARLAKSADQCVTVSDTLAAHLTSEYGLPFRSVPNATPLADADGGWVRERRAELKPPSTTSQATDKVTFLFQGGFAAGRGLEMLVDAWKDVDERAVLMLRGPDNEHKKQVVALAQSNGTLDKSVFFPPAVTERELIDSAFQADVGLIPYDPRLYGNKFACPNKLSQYMAAGLPIISNSIEYVSGIIVGNRIGEAVAFHNRTALVCMIDEFSKDTGKRQEYGRNSRSYFETTFNWENLAHDVVEAVKSAAAGQPVSTGTIALDWIEADPTMRGQIADTQPPQKRLRKLWHLMPRRMRYWLASHLQGAGLIR